jgi:hypothetical protein
MDTGEVVTEEPMTDQEKQLNLFAAQQEFAKFMQDQGVEIIPESGEPAGDESESGEDDPPVN